MPLTPNYIIQLKDERILKVLDSYVVNREMPVNYVEGELDFCKSEFSYRTHEVKIIELKNCIVNYGGFAFEQEKLLLNKFSLVDEDHYKSMLTRTYFIKNILIRRKRKLDPDRYLLAFDDWSNLHYHWFCDTIPRLFSMRELLKDYILLLPDSPYVRNVGLPSLDFFGLNPAGIEYVQDFEHVKMKNLSIVTYTCLSGYINDKVMADMQERISSQLHGPIATNKIYVTRDRTHYRKVLNEPEIWDVVKNNGYDIVRFEDFTWKEQVAIASSAKSMVSMHGAGLVNAMFMNRGSAVLEFRRNKIYHNQCFWHLCAALKLDYYYLFGKPDNDDLVLEGGECCNLTIDPERLHHTLLQMDSRMNK
ncbi:MAG: glycosyltransferase family 61 protein [Bacteroidia bacterium]